MSQAGVHVYEIRFHGRGGQGAVMAAQTLAEAAVLQGYHAQAFPYFGAERRGAPVKAFTRIDEKRISLKSQIYQPDMLVVLDGGLPEIERKCRLHALNIKEVCRREAAKIGKTIEEVNYVAAHMGGGISVAALKGGKVIDVNDALLGMGPFSPDRAGALPIGPLVKLCYSGTYTEKEMLTKLSKHSGLLAYTGQSDLREVEKMIEAGDEKTKLYFEAMAYQIAKEIGAMAVVLSGDFEAIVLTGGMANSDRLVREITQCVSFLKEVIVVPGEFEMEALASAGLRVISDEETLQPYETPETPQ